MIKKFLKLLGAATLAWSCWYSYTVVAGEFYYAALGDSGTTGFNSKESWNNKDYSWATGTKLESHFMRLKKYLPMNKIRVINMAVPGVHVSDLARQADQASDIPLDYATILIGANDFCAAGMDTEIYKAKIVEAIGIMKEASPKVKVLLSSLPNMVKVRHIASGMTCDFLWKKAMEHCDVSDEITFYKQWRAANDALKDIANSTENVKYSEALSVAVIDEASLSKIDCFHPSLEAQAKIAETTWNEGFFK